MSEGMAYRNVNTSQCIMSVQPDQILPIRQHVTLEDRSVWRLGPGLSIGSIGDRVTIARKYIKPADAAMYYLRNEKTGQQIEGRFMWDRSALEVCQKA